MPHSTPGQAPTLTFLGGTGTVTGSRFLVDTAEARVLVDCGLFQGPKHLRLRNWERLPVDPATIDAVVLSHAHVDHCAYLPALCRDGFAGAVHATPGTIELCRIVLPDAGHLQEEEAAYANRKGFSKHRPALPLFTKADAEAVLEQLTPLAVGTEREIALGVSVTLRRAGHILGSASVYLALPDGRTMGWSGDLGRPDHPYLLPPEPCAGADVMLLESTYGDREHDLADGRAELADAVRRTVGRGGTIVIPSFAVDRTEVLLFHLRRLLEAGEIPDVPLYVDSPMASAALSVYRRAVDEGWPEIRPELAAQDLFDPEGLVEVRDVEASKRLDQQRYPSIVISASGMATGGRVLHHLQHRLPDPRNTILLPGYQAEGTRGRQLIDGARQIKLLGRYVPVRAEVVNLPAFSVHAGQSELVSWLTGSPTEPEATYLVHGEEPALAALAETIGDRTGWTAVVPRHGERVRLD